MSNSKEKQAEKTPVELIQESFKKKYILVVDVVGKTIHPEKGKCSVCSFRGITCLMPENEIEIAKANWVVDRTGLLIGAKTEAIVIGFTGEGIPVVSRKLAMQRRRRQFDEKVNVGDIINGRVVGVSVKNVFVEAYGYEFVLLAQDVDYKWIHDMRTRFTIGESVKAKVISKDPPRISIKEALVTPWDTNPNKYKVGDEYVGRVVAIAPMGIFVDLLEDGRQVLCPPFGRQTPLIDSIVVVRIKDIDVPNKKMWGDIIRIISQPQF